MPQENISNTEQGNLSFFLARPLTSQEFRGACSRWLGGSDWVAALAPADRNRLFHHQPDGRPIMGLSPFRFYGESHFGHIQAIGPAAIALLRQVADSVRALPHPTPWLGQPQWSVSVNALQLDDQPQHYWAPELVICKNAEQHRVWTKATQDSKLAHVRTVIKKGIERQLALLGRSSEITEPEVKAISRERVIPRVPQVNANAFVRVATVAFSAPIVLEGHWAAGGLVSRGYGRILPLRWRRSTRNPPPGDSCKSPAC